MEIIVIDTDIACMSIASTDTNPTRCETLTIDTEYYATAHIYINEPIPEEIIHRFSDHHAMQDATKILTKIMHFENGQLLIAGAEYFKQHATKTGFKGINIPKGTYKVSVYPLNSEEMSMDTHIAQQLSQAIQNDAILALGEKQYLKSQWLQKRFIDEGCFLFFVCTIALIIALFTLTWLYKLFALGIYILSFFLFSAISKSKALQTLSHIQQQHESQWIYDFIIHLEPLNHVDKTVTKINGDKPTTS